MRASFASFWSKNLSAARLAILSHLEYRVDFLVDAVFQPILSTSVELALWFSLLSKGGLDQVNGFSRVAYLSYILWTTFVSRVTSNWMYEFEMTDEIESGRVNVILLRPISFYEYYLSQFLGYKLSTLGVSFLIPATISYIFSAQVYWERLPGFFLLILLYLIFSHTLSFLVATLGFYMTRVKALTAIKNMSLAIFTGELFPLDLFPGDSKRIIMNLPFASGAYAPIAYLTGRIDGAQLVSSLESLVIGIGVVGLIAMGTWKRGVRLYTGTGA